jgi:predicted enzyme related to lactoylglutathione lyase
MAGEIVHFEVPVDDVEKMKSFYEKVLGWEIKEYEGSDMGNGAYWMIMPSDDEKAIGGGMQKKQMPEQRPMNYYTVDSIEGFNQRVKENGGMVVIEKMPVPGMGWFSVAVDPEGNPVGSWVEDKSAKME